MNKDQIAGSAQQAKGAVKETAGKAVGNPNLKAEGKADKVDGKVRKAVGDIKENLKKH